MANSKAAESKKYWFDLVLFYCSKRETSRARLSRYLKRKVKEYKIPEEQCPTVLTWIEEVLEECVRLKMVDDERYAGILHREYLRRGKGKRYITQKLAERGLTAEVPALEFAPEYELSRAVELAQKTLSRSSIQKLKEPYEIKNKLLQKLVASGFDYDIAKRATQAALALPNSGEAEE